MFSSFNISTLKFLSVIISMFFSATTLERTFPRLVDDKQNRSFQKSLCVTQTTEQTPPLPEDCASIYKEQLNRTSGIYEIQPQFLNQSIFVYCDMETSGGGWTLIQRRGDFGKPVENFYRSWVKYKKRFWKFNPGVLVR
ncbi:techylectin-5B-like [Tachypleus tridentatus]|uniref:techylectin-5B-like n=1 Tax=Tachypleus tridentatus TaxID=6853 RepID=UPI003FD4AD0D